MLRFSHFINIDESKLSDVFLICLDRIFFVGNYHLSDLIFLKSLLESWLLNRGKEGKKRLGQKFDNQGYVKLDSVRQ